MFFFFSHVPTTPMETSLYRMSRALAEFQAIHRSVTVEMVNVFLMVALDEGQRSIDYSRKTGLSQSTISRYLLDLSQYRRQLTEDSDTGRQEGHGLIWSEVDPQELRAKRYFLTPRGKAIRDRVVGLLEGSKSISGPAKSVLSLTR
ncbi:MAG: MarR family winged helix-turn-helix transcriptional regulator [Alphaproteobacteria bacterium]|nr:MarR family winged helix-turn-helix transcriptional regulator [Alphaproteobacteria bacterium]